MEGERMLVLSRKEDESVIIDRQITVKILRIENGKVSLGIDAPDDVPIDREEIHEAKDRGEA